MRVRFQLLVARVVSIGLIPAALAAVVVAPAPPQDNTALIA